MNLGCYLRFAASPANPNPLSCTHLRYSILWTVEPVGSDAVVGHILHVAGTTVLITPAPQHRITIGSHWPWDRNVVFEFAGDWLVQ